MKVMSQRIINDSKEIFFFIVNKGSVKLIQRVKIGHSFLQPISNLFHYIILGLPLWFYIWLSKNFSKCTSKNGEMGHF